MNLEAHSSSKKSKIYKPSFHSCCHWSVCYYYSNTKEIGAKFHKEHIFLAHSRHSGNVYRMNKLRYQNGSEGRAGIHLEESMWQE